MRKDGVEVLTEPFWAPLMRTAYNIFMSGVDLIDMDLGWCCIRLKRVGRWWIPILMTDLDLFVNNSMYHFRDFQEDWGLSPIGAKEFRLQLIRQIKDRHCVRLENTLASLLKAQRRERQSRRPATVASKASRAAAPPPPLATTDDGEPVIKISDLHVVDETDETKGNKAPQRLRSECVICKANLAKVKTQRGSLNREYHHSHDGIKTTFVCIHPSCSPGWKKLEKPSMAKGPTSRRVSTRTYVHPQCMASHMAKFHGL